MSHVVEKATEKNFMSWAVRMEYTPFEVTPPEVWLGSSQGRHHGTR
jgi:hypothetical protein